MGVTYANGSIAGNVGIREYDFLVDTGSTWMTLPPDAIAELELDAISGQVAEITTPTDRAIAYGRFNHRHSRESGNPVTEVSSFVAKIQQITSSGLRLSPE